MEVKTYDIELSISDMEGVYYGEVAIGISKPDKTILVDSYVDQVLDVLVNGHEVNFKYDRDAKKITVNNVFDTDIDLSIKYTNKISDSLNGIYHCGGENNEMISTDLEPMNARSVFPCFDDPSAKARFSLKVIIPPGYDAISNTAVDTEIFVNGKREIKFNTTPKMATYLFYLGIGRMEESKIMYRGKEIILAAPGQIRGDAGFALKTASECLAFYESYFSIDYSLDKLHLIAVPDFAPGAMENWGAITFRNEKLLLADSNDIDQKREICDTIAHEIAHQWFGNLVTLSKWGDLWLNEAFATLMASKFISKVHPELGGEETFVENYIFSSMIKDSLLSTHPIKADVAESEFEQIFDEISYGKGAAILRMIENAMGEENFREAISRYLKEKEYGNGTVTDLWYFLNASSTEINVPDMASNWIQNAGFPMIRAEKSNDDTILVRQERFLLNGKDQSSWEIPLFLRTDAGAREIIMEGKTMELPDNGILSFNRNVFGYYIFDFAGYEISGNSDGYDLAYEEMSRFLLLLKGDIQFSSYLEFIAGKIDKFSYPFFTNCSSNILHLYFISDGNFELSSRFSNILRKMLQTSFTVKDDPVVFYARESINRSLAIIDSSYSDMMGSRISKIEKYPVYEHEAIIIGASRSRITFHRILSHLKTTGNSNLYSKLCRGIGFTDSLTNQIRVLNMISDGRIKTQEIPGVLHSMILNHRSRKMIIRVFGTIVNAIRKKFGESGAASIFFEYSIPYLGLVDREEINTKIQKYGLSDSNMGIKTGQEMLDIYANLRTRLK